jgi:hypothetical protein
MLAASLKAMMTAEIFTAAILIEIREKRELGG